MLMFYFFCYHCFRVLKFSFQAQDDKRDGAISLEDLLPNEPVHPISYDALLILLGMCNYRLQGSYIRYVYNGMFLKLSKICTSFYFISYIIFDTWYLIFYISYLISHISYLIVDILHFVLHIWCILYCISDIWYFMFCSSHFIFIFPNLIFGNSHLIFNICCLVYGVWYFVLDVLYSIFCISHYEFL
jgi:hypothetical protein